MTGLRKGEIASLDQGELCTQWKAAPCNSGRQGVETSKKGCTATPSRVGKAASQLVGRLKKGRRPVPETGWTEGVENGQERSGAGGNPLP